VNDGKIPKRFKTASMATLDKEQFGMVIEYSSHASGYTRKGRGLLLSGPPGVGKTWAIAALMHAAGYKNTFVTAPDLFDSYKSFGEQAYSSYHGQPWDEVFERTPWLVLNDLGKEYRAGNMGEQVVYKLGRLLRARSERGLVTHITTNILLTKNDADDETLDFVYGSSIMSLLRETMVAYTVDGPDRRSA